MSPHATGAIEERVPNPLSPSLTRTSWLPGEGIGLSDWVDHGRRLGVIGRCVGWWIGDWLRYGNLKFGERYAWASRITGYDAQTLMNMVYVASAYDVAERRPSLSFSHHAELAALPPDERERWLDLAEENRLSVRCLRGELRRARRLEAGVEDADEAGADGAPQLPATAGDQDAPDDADAASARCPHCGHELDESAVTGEVAAAR
jgi:hypothetical protein